MRQFHTPARDPRAPRISAWVALALTTVLIPAALGAQAVNELPRGESGQYERPEAAQEAIAQLRSPYCPTMLAVCSSGAGAALRDSISRLADEGWTADELVEWVLANHGEEYRALPKTEGKSLVAWVVPPFGLLGGLFLVVVALRHMRRGRQVVAPIEGELSDEEEHRLRAAMKELDQEEEATFF